MRQRNLEDWDLELLLNNMRNGRQLGDQQSTGRPRMTDLGFLAILLNFLVPTLMLAFYGFLAWSVVRLIRFALTLIERKVVAQERIANALEEMKAG